MMRENKRAQILDAAFRVVQREGIAAVTFDSVAAEAELTKGGLLYHFPSREALLEGLHEHLAQTWESSLEDAAGTTAEQATPHQRLAAYARVSATSCTRAELLLMVEATSNPTLRAHWQQVHEKWVPGPTTAPLSSTDLQHFVLRLAAEGLWLYESFAATLDPALRTQVAEFLATGLSVDALDATDTEPSEGGQ